MRRRTRWARRRRRLERSLRQRAWELRRSLPIGRPPALPPWTGPQTTLPPLIVGGTGRSGTTVTGYLLGEHRDYHTIPFEVRFLSERGGICDLVAGRTTIMAFERRLLGRWYRRTGDVGFHQITDRATLRALVVELNEQLKVDRRAAAERFVHRLLDPPAIAAGARGWIEMTPATAQVADRLLAILPTARLVHSVRDGRDVACSVRPLFWGPTDLDEALDWWATGLERAFAAVAASPRDRVLTVRMERLLETDRDGQYDRLRAFAGLDDDPAMRAFFNGEVTADRAHIGRWRQEVAADQLAAFDDHYQRLAAELSARWDYQAEVGPGAGPG